MSIGAVAQDLNIPKWISAHMSSLFEGRGAVMAISFSYVLGVIVNFLMTPMAAVGALGSPLAQLAVSLYPRLRPAVRSEPAALPL